MSFFLLDVAKNTPIRIVIHPEIIPKVIISFKKTAPHMIPNIGRNKQQLKF